MASKTIQLKGDIVRKERVADTAITPGMLIQIKSAADTVQPHATANGFAQTAFALENDLVGKSIGDPAGSDATARQEYAIGEMVQYGVFQKGAEVNAILAQGQNVTEGAYLTSNGAGLLTACGSPGTTDYPVAIALEAVNASSAKKRIRVEVL